MTTDHRVVLIAGTGQNGATILSRVLAQLPSFVAVGELGHLWDKGLIENRACACGAPFLECPFWSHVGRAAFGGWDRVDAREMTRLRGTLLLKRTLLPHPFALPLLRWPSLSKRYGSSLEAYQAQLRRVYEGIAIASGATYIVDSMKVPAHVYTVAGIPQVGPHVVQLVRDARGVAYSSMKLVERQGKDTDPYRVRRPPAKSALRWTWINESFHRLGARVPSTLVRYESFVDDPAREVRRIGIDVGAEPGENDLEFIRSGTVSLPADHLFAGNRVRFNEGPITLREDNEWRTAVARRQQRAIGLLARPLMTRYGYDPSPSDAAPD